MRYIAAGVVIIIAGIAIIGIAAFFGVLLYLMLGSVISVLG